MFLIPFSSLTEWSGHCGYLSHTQKKGRRWRDGCLSDEAFDVKSTKKAVEDCWSFPATLSKDHLSINKIGIPFHDREGTTRFNKSVQFQIEKWEERKTFQLEKGKDFNEKKGNIPIRKRKIFQLQKGKYSNYKKENISNLSLEIKKWQNKKTKTNV